MAQQEHHHDHGHGHAHGHTHKDLWDGEQYLQKDNIREAAASSADNVFFALRRAGLDADALAPLNLLEIGCGPGLVTALLAPAFASTHAIDVSPNMLRTFASQPAAALPGVTWAQHTLHAGSGDDLIRARPAPSPTVDDPDRMLPPPRERFDVAVANLVVHHVDNLDQFFKGVFNVLAPGGTVVITEFSTLPNGRDVAAEIREQIAAEELAAGKQLPEGTVNAPGHFHAQFSPELIGALLNKYGFIDVGGARRGEIAVFGKDKEGREREKVPTLYCYGTKPK